MTFIQAISLPPVKKNILLSLIADQQYRCSFGRYGGGHGNDGATKSEAGSRIAHGASESERDTAMTRDEFH